jgi:type IV secretion system protein VirD4
MKNYAGHRLSPWLGHLMVSRQETARPLLTPGEVMQLPPEEEVIQISGAAPIRALKVRYYLDPRLAGRVGSPPSVATRLVGPPDDWGSVVAAGGGAEPPMSGPVDEGGHRIEPELEGIDQEAVQRSEPDADLEVDGEGDDAQQAADLQRRFKAVAKQAALDLNDGIAL